MPECSPLGDAKIGPGFQCCLPGPSVTGACHPSIDGQCRILTALGLPTGSPILAFPLHLSAVALS